MLRLILLLSLALTQLPITANAKAKAAAPVYESFRFEYQLQRVDQRAVQLLGAQHQKTLRQMAEAAVLSDFCPVIKLDQDKFKRDFDGLGSVGPKRKPAEQRDFENKLMTTFGMYVGLLVAEGAESQVEFCELAGNIQKNQGPVSRYWLAATVPATAPEPAKK